MLPDLTIRRAEIRATLDVDVLDLSHSKTRLSVVLDELCRVKRLSHRTNYAAVELVWNPHLLILVVGHILAVLFRHDAVIEE